MKYGSVCSGIEAASVAWEPLGWRPEWFAEIEPFPSAALAHHWPHVTNLGDMTAIAKRVLTGQVVAPDVLVGGTPCQAFSVAGMREGLRDERGQLTIKFVELADAIDAVRVRDGKPETIIVWENVPGVLSDKENAFGCFLGALAGEGCELQPSGKRWTNAGCAYGPQRAVAWRVLDAQYFGVAQRRRRVFVVASARAGFDPAAVLFESEGVRRDTAPSREAGQGFAADVAPSLVSSGRGVERVGETRGQDPVVAVPTKGFRMAAFGEYVDDETASTAKARDYKDATDLAVTVSLRGREGGATAELGGPIAGTLRAATGGGDKPHVLTSGVTIHGTDKTASVMSFTDICGSLRTKPPGSIENSSTTAIYQNMAVRRLTPVECERLQGFPDGHTNVPYRNKPAADGPRYKAIGNSMAVPVMRWIGDRITAVDAEA